MASSQIPQEEKDFAVKRLDNLRRFMHKKERTKTISNEAVVQYANDYLDRVGQIEKMVQQNNDDPTLQRNQLLANYQWNTVDPAQVENQDLLLSAPLDGMSPEKLPAEELVPTDQALDRVLFNKEQVSLQKQEQQQGED